MRSLRIKSAAALAVAVAATAVIGSGLPADASGPPGIPDAQQRCQTLGGTFADASNPNTGRTEFECYVPAKRMTKPNVKDFLYDCYVLYADRVGVPFTYAPNNVELGNTSDVTCFEP